MRIETVKAFGEPMGAAVERRIGALRPGYYTRIGAAVRHAAAELAGQPQRKKLLLVLTDGKPNDVDHYEGRFAVEDTRKAVREARRLGVAVFGVTVDASAQSYFPTLFGRGGYAIVGNVRPAAGGAARDLSRPDALRRSVPSDRRPGSGGGRASIISTITRRIYPACRLHHRGVQAT